MIEKALAVLASLRAIGLRQPVPLEELSVLNLLPWHDAMLTRGLDPCVDLS